MPRDIESASPQVADPSAGVAWLPSRENSFIDGRRDSVAGDLAKLQCAHDLVWSAMKSVEGLLRTTCEYQDTFDALSNLRDSLSDALGDSVNVPIRQCNEALELMDARSTK